MIAGSFFSPHLMMNIWLDEAASYFMARQSWGFIFSSLDFHPPLYFFLLKVWIGVFGSGSIRLMSLAFALGSAYLSSKLFRRYCSRTTSLFFFGINLLINTTFLFHATQARMYAAGAFFVLWAYDLHLDGKRYAFVPMTLALYTHYFTILALLPLALSCRYKKSVPQPLLSLVLFSAYTPILIQQAAARIHAEDWYNPVTIRTLLSNYFNYTAHVETFHAVWLQGIIIIITILCMGIALANLTLNRRRTGWCLLIALLVIPLFYMIASSFIGSMHHPRYFFFFMPFFLITVFAVEKRWADGFFILITILNLILLGGFAAEQDYELENISHYIMQNKDASVLLHEHPSSLLPVMYYLREENFTHVMVRPEQLSVYGGYIILELERQGRLSIIEDGEKIKEKKIYYLQSKKNLANGLVLLKLKGIKLVLSHLPSYPTIQENQSYDCYERDESCTDTHYHVNRDLSDFT